MEPSMRKAGAGAILLLLALALLVGGALAPFPSATQDVVRAIYYAGSSIILALAVLVWSSR